MLRLCLHISVCPWPSNYPLTFGQVFKYSVKRNLDKNPSWVFGFSVVVSEVNLNLPKDMDARFHVHSKQYGVVQRGLR